MLKNCKLYVDFYYLYGCKGNKEYELGKASSLSYALEYADSFTEYHVFSLYGKLSDGSLVYLGSFDFI